MFAALQGRLSYANVVATLALVLALGGGAYAATSFVGSNGQISACVGKKGQLTLLKPGRKCGRGKQTVRWNQQGVRGLQGGVGAPGNPGTPGVGVGGSEAWHEVGKPGEPAFAAITCSGHPCFWVNSRDSAFGLDGDTTSTAFYRDPLGVVHLKGAPCSENLLSSDCESGTSVPFGGTTIFTLPAGDRPDHEWNFDVLGANGAAGFNDGRISVHPDGTVRVVRPTNVTWVTLDGITFRAAN